MSVTRAHRGAPGLGIGLAIAVFVFVFADGARADERTDAKLACASAAEDAEQLRIDGRLLAARDRLLQCARPECPATVRSDCATWMNQVAAAIPSITLAVRDRSGRDVLDAQVSIDGATVAHALDGKPLDLDPGTHAIRVQASGAVAERTVLVRQGEQGRPVTVVLDAPPPSPSAPGAPPETPPPPVGATSGLHPSAWTWVLGGLGVVAVGVGAYLELSVNSDAAGLQATCGHSCSHGQVDPLVLKQQVLGPIAFGVGAVALGLATYTLFLSPRTGGAVAGLAGAF
jgi:hypothetical protein